MTPEERADRILEAWPHDDAETSATESEWARLAELIAAAIREAVKAELEGAAAMAESAQRDASTGGAYAVWNRACSRIAAAIRARTP